MAAWVYQDSKQVKKHGAEAASWYVGWIDPEGKRRCKSCGAGQDGVRLAARVKRQVEAELLAGTYTARGRRLASVRMGESEANVPLPGWKARRPVVGDDLDPGCGSFVYLVEAVGANRIKIGLAANVKGRLAGLQTACPVPLRLLGAIRGGEALEQSLHGRFASYRLHGEWFEAAEEIRAFAASLSERINDDL